MPQVLLHAPVNWHRADASRWMSKPRPLRPASLSACKPATRQAAAFARGRVGCSLLSPAPEIRRLDSSQQAQSAQRLVAADNVPESVAVGEEGCGAGRALHTGGRRVNKFICKRRAWQPGSWQNGAAQQAVAAAASQHACSGMTVAAHVSHGALAGTRGSLHSTALP